jgi:tetratricopeptide (TPR) repeat protein
MKNTYIIILFILVASACSKDFLKETARTQITVDQIYKTPEGLASAVIGLYFLDRGFLRIDGESDSWLQLNRGCDLTASVAGSGNAAYANYDPAGRQGNEQWTRNIWNFHYNMTGKATEIIFYGADLDQNNANVKRAIAEASFFRAQSYFWLYRLYERIYISETPTTPQNVNDPVEFKPASKEAIFALLNKDLDNAIANLPATAGTEPGRLTQAAARHVKALVLMWEGKYQDAVNQCEAIFADPNRRLVTVEQVFGTQSAPLAELNHAEALYVWQYANRAGGANGTTPQGHRLNAHFLTNYQSSTGIRSYPNGGGGWGRVLPNSYLRSLYDRSTDKRIALWFKETFIYDDPTQQSKWPAGTKVGDTVKFAVNSSLWVARTHPSSMKYYDPLTSGTAASLVSFKDVMVYRLAETHLMAAEAYMRLGNQAKALEHYNKTFVRAGNPPATGTVTLEMIMDEHARELCLESHRWSFLKRIGRLIDQVQKYAGDAGIPGLSAVARQNIKEYQLVWPIPQTALDAMGRASFPQNPGYLP